MYDGEFDDEVGGERGDGQVEALEPERGHAEDHSDQRRDEPRGGKDEQEGNAASGERGSGVRAHREEGGVAERNLPGEPGEDVETHRGDHGDADAVADVHPVAGGEERHREQDGEEYGEQHPRHGRVEDGHVGRVGGAEVAAAHARNLLQTRSMRTLPKSPYGLTMRMTTRAAKGATSFTPPPNTGSR